MSNNTTFDFNAYLSEENRSLEDYIETSDPLTNQNIEQIVSFA